MHSKHRNGPVTSKNGLAAAAMFFIFLFFPGHLITFFWYDSDHT